MKVYEGLARAFVAEGVTDVFGMMGDGNMHWMQAMHENGVNVYDVRHEGAGLAMADGWGRVAKDRRVDVPGVCTATHGPGVAQLATTMLVAARANTPLIAFVGEGPAGDDEFVQRLDHKRFAEATECLYMRIATAESANEVVRKAFYTAKHESRPVMIGVSVAVQLDEHDDLDEYQPSSALMDVEPPYPSPDALRRATEIISNSTRPVVVVGRGAIWSGAGEAALELAERIGALVATTLMAKTWLSEDEFHVGISGLYSTRTAMQLFEETDCVIALGAGLNKYTTEYGYLYPNAQYIQIDTKPHVVMGGGRTADCYVQADARVGAELINKQLAEQGFEAAGYRTPDVRARLQTAFEDTTEFETEPGTLDPREVCLTLDDALPSNIGLILGGGHQITFGTILFTKGRSLVLANQHFGCIGQGLTTAIGAVIAAGNHPSLLIEGDAGFLMHLPEFETAVRYNLPLMVVIVNDEGLGAEYHKMNVKGLDSKYATISSPDLGGVAVALGGRGRLARDISDVRKAAEEFVANPGPMIVDVRASRNVLSVPYRRLHYGIDA